MKPASRKDYGLALGLERIGLISLRYPIAIGVILLALTVAAAFGIGRIQIDDSLSQLFRSDTPQFRTYEYVTQQFPSTEFDVLIAVSGPNLLQRKPLEQLREAVTDLQLVDGVRGVISMFSARQPPQAGQLPAALFPEDLPQGADYDRLIEHVRSNEIIKGKLLSDDGQLALVVLALDPPVVRSNALGATLDAMRKAIDEDLRDRKSTRLDSSH